MKVIIIEDELGAYTNLRTLLLELCDNIEILAHLESVADSVAWFKSNAAPDLIFLDIHLADGSAFSIFECITIDTPIVFTTAYDQYALKAFEVNSVDYLLKPVGRDAVKRAIDKFNSSKMVVRDPFEWDSQRVKRLLVSFRDKILPLKVEDVAFVYNTGGRTSITTLQGKTYAVGKSLDALMARLEPELFFRTNRQYIVSRNAIESFTIWDDSRLSVHLSVEIPEPIFIAKNRANEFKSWLVLL